MTSRINLYVRQPDFTRGRPIDDFITFKPTPRFNDMGTWTLDLNLESRAAEELLSGDGYGIMSSRKGQPLLSGPVDSRLEALSSDGRETLQLAGPDDNCWLAWRSVIPCPPTSFAGMIYPDSAYDYEAGSGEDVLRSYVSTHLGSGAALARQLMGMTQDVNLSRGTHIDEQARFQSLLEILQRSAVNGGGLGFRLVQDGDHLDFQVYQPVDRSETVIFGPNFGNISERKFETKGPTANYFIMGGGGEGTSRFFIEAGDDDSIAKWGRREKFVDSRDTSEFVVLVQRLVDEIAKGAETKSLAITPIEEQSVDFNGDFHPYFLLEDYFVGDVISNNVRGVTIKEQVTSAEIVVSGKSSTVKPILGADPDMPDLFKTIRDLKRQVKTLQAR